MRVLVVTESFLPTVNGVTTSVCKVLENLRNRGHDALVMVPSCGAPATYAGFPVVEIPAIPYRQFPVGLPGLHVQRIMEDFGPDVVHVASPFLLGGEAIASSRRLGIPTVAIFQTDVAGYARRNRLSVFQPLAWKILRRIHRDATLTLVPSSATMKDLRSAGLKRLKRWGRGVDLETYHPRNRDRPEVNELRAELAPNDEVVIGYVGRVAPEKQLENLAALRGVPGISVAIVGDGPGMPLIRKRLEGMPVTFLGQLRGEHLASAYASFDVFLHTGEEETFGQTVQEAHASGLPVVAPRSGGPIDLVTPGVTGFLYGPGDIRELRRTIELLTGDPALRLRMGEAGRRGVVGRSWETVCDQLIAHYASVVARQALLSERKITVGAVAGAVPRVRKVS
ncbi:MAG TPA: glycosyltransferase family 1 protein [Galbitalea sp.]|jgi:phosphatidylinositol alpha 1,6-mannosyltransferase|nr:glycosyltransferase family 1 protein [Galbitalea sp.]